MNSLDTSGVISDEKDLAHESDQPKNMSEMFHQNGYTGIPYVEIIEQPAPKALRFRYECEGRSAGSIPGKNSSPENKTYPTIKIHNFKGNAVIIVSCVTKDEPYRAHPHNLVGKEGCKNGICTVEVEGDNMTVAFPNLGIQCVKKKDIEQALKLREKIKVDPFQQKFAHMNQPSSIDLNSVRLCFQVFLRDSNNKKILHVPAPVVSDPIDDKKAKSDLIITKLSHTSAPAKSRQEIILLCEKVAKEDIEIHFFEKAANGEIIWSKPAEFAPGHVHKQVAISFRTPIYDREIEVSSKVQVYIELKRPSDGAKSEPYPFHFTAEDKSGKIIFELLRSFKSDFSDLTQILVDTSHPLTKELLVFQRTDKKNCAFSVDQNNMKKSMIPEFVKENTYVEANNQCIENENDEDPKMISHTLPNELKKNYTECLSKEAINDDSLVKYNISEILENTYEQPNEGVVSSAYSCKSAVKKSRSFSSEEAVDNLSNVSPEKLEQLGVVFSGSEESLERLPFKEFLENVNNEKNKLKYSSHEFNENVINVKKGGGCNSLQNGSNNKVSIANKYGKYLNVRKDCKDLTAAPPRPASAKPDFKKTSEVETVPPLPPKRIKKNPNARLPRTPEKPSIPFLSRMLLRTKKTKKEDNAVEEPEDLSNNLSSKCRLTVSALDLTEAEHYALYTSIAPRATDSEFDEMSCYYSQVEARCHPFNVFQ